MATPLKVLTALSASYGAAVSGSSGLQVNQGGVTVNGGDLRLNNNAIKASDGNTSITLNSTSAKIEGDLTVGSGHFKVGNNVESLIADTATGYIAAQYGFAVTGSTTTSGSLTVGGNGLLSAGTASLGGLTVTQNGIVVSAGGANITGQLTANTGLVVTGGAILVENGGISGSSTLQVGGAATFANNVTVAGNLTVNGTTTTVNSTELLITDDKIIIASGSADAFDANGAGIFLGNESPGVASIQYVSSSFGSLFHKWKLSENLDLESGKGYYLGDSLALNKNTNGTTLANVLSNGGPSSLGKVVVGAVDDTGAAQLGIDAGSGSFITGSQIISLKAPTITLSGTTETVVSNKLRILGEVTASAVSGTRGDFSSLFVNGVAVSTGGGGGGGDVTKTEINNEYNSLRLIISGTLNGSGHVDVDLTTLNATNFGVASLHSCSVDVLTDTDGTGWTNDLVSVRLEVSDSKLYVKIDAPAAPNAGYRLIAVNEKDFLLA